LLVTINDVPAPGGDTEVVADHKSILKHARAGLHLVRPTRCGDKMRGVSAVPSQVPHLLSDRKFHSRRMGFQKGTSKQKNNSLIHSISHS
jgi:hypothetical protein